MRLLPLNELIITEHLMILKIQMLINKYLTSCSTGRRNFSEAS